MKKCMIRLSTIMDVRNFVDIVSSAKTDVDLSSGRYVVDAKSIMGIFSLDLMKPIQLTARQDDPELFEKIKPFIVE